MQSRLNQVLEEGSSTGKALQSIYEELGITLYDQEGQIRSLYSVLTDLSQIWDRLDTNTKARLALEQAGANQTQNFLALMNNFDTVLEATATAYDSAGSAAQENAKVVDSLAGRTKALKAEFEDLANNTISNGLVKVLLTLATSVLKILNTSLGTFVVRVGLVTASIWGLLTVLKAGKWVVNFIGQFKLLTTTLTATGAAAQTAAGGFAVLQAAAAPLALGIGLVVAAISGFLDYQNKLAENAAEVARENQELINSYQDLRKQYIDIVDSAKTEGQKDKELAEFKETLIKQYGFEEEAIDGVINKRKEMLDYLDQESAKQAQANWITTQRQYEKDLENYQKQLRGQSTIKLGYTNVYGIGAGYPDSDLKTYQHQIEQIEKIAEAHGVKMRNNQAFHYFELDASDLQNAQQLEDFYQDLYDYLDKLPVKGAPLKTWLNTVSSAFTKLSAVMSAVKLGDTEPIKATNDAYEYLAKNVINTKEDYDAYIETIKQAYVTEEGQQAALAVLNSQYGEFANVVEDAGNNLQATSATAQTLNKVFEETDKSSNLTLGTLNELVALYPTLSSHLVDATGCLTEEGEAALSSKSSLMELISSTILLNTTELSLTDQVNQLYDLAIAAGVATENMVLLRELKSGDSRAGKAIVAEYGSIANYYREQIIGSVKATETLPKATKSKGSSRTSSSGSRSTTDTVLESRKEAVTLAKNELTFLENSNAARDLQIAKMKDIQKALSAQADYMRSIGAKESDIKQLSAEWWQWQNKINDAVQDFNKETLNKTKEYYEDLLESVNRQIKAYETYFGLMADAIDDEISGLQKQREELEKQNDDLQKQVELEEKLNALAQAKSKQQLVYKDGRFQYVSDVDAVSEAADDLDEYYRKQEYQAQLDAIDAQIAILQTQKEQLQAQVQAISTAQEIKEVLETIGIDMNSGWRYNYTQLEQQIKDYQDLQNRANGYSSSIENITDVINGKMDRDAIVQQMIANSVAWGSADTAGKQTLHNANVVLGSSLGWSYNAASGQWIDENGRIAYLVPSAGQAGASTSATTSGYTGSNYSTGGSSGGGGSVSRKPDNSSAEAQAAIKDIAQRHNVDLGVAEDMYNKNNQLGYTKYATGTMNANGGLSLVGEQGAELRVLNQGDGILTANITKNLWNWGKLNPLTLTKDWLNGNNSKTINIGTINLPQVQDGEGFVNYLTTHFFGSAVQMAT